VGALWTGALAINTAVKWLNNIHEVEETRSTVHRWLLNVGLTAAAGGLFTISFITFFALQVSGDDIARRLGMEGAFSWLLSIGRWPLAFALVVLGAAVLYKVGPDRPRDNRWVTLGAFGFGVVWLLGTFGFVFYVSHFGSYNATYGLLGAVLLLATWFYITSLAFLVGAELDAASAAEVGEEAAATGHEHGNHRTRRPGRGYRQAEPPPFEGRGAR
jgi:membrane protein